MIVGSAYAGVGKTQIATEIACNVALSGKKVYYFALEAGDREIDMRIAFKFASMLYAREASKEYFDVRYDLYKSGQIQT